MASNKQIRSPFGLFMRKMSLENVSLRKQSFDKTVKYCDQIYQRMTSEEKKPFERLSQIIRDNRLNDHEVNQRLKQLNTNSNNDKSEDSLQNSGTILSNCNKGNSQNETKQVVKVLDDYERVINAIDSQKDIKNTSFIVISFNILVQTQDGKYFPNEVGLTKFSLFDGIQDTYHKLIYNKIPDGYFSVAKQLSESTHKIPLNPKHNPMYEQNYEMLFHQIYQFMASTHLIDSKAKKLVFCKTVDCDGREDKPQVIGCLKWLANQVINTSKDGLKDKKVSDFHVIDLSELLYVLIQKYCSSPRPRSLIIDDLSKCVYDYYTNISCDFHEEIENRFCAVGVTKRLTYLLFDSFFKLKSPEIEMKPNENHKPKEQKAGSIEVSNFEFRDVKTNVERQDRYHSNYESNTNKKPLDLNLTKPFVPGIRTPYSSGIGRGRSINKFRKIDY